MNQAPDPAPQTPPPSPSTSSTGLAENVAGALAYLMGPVTGIIFLVLEKNSSFVKFHAAQSIGIFVIVFVAFIALSIVSTILSLVPIVGWIVGLVLLFVSIIAGFGGLFLWLFLMYKAYSGEEWEFPWVGEQSRKMLLKG